MPPQNRFARKDRRNTHAKGEKGRERRNEPLRPF